MRRIALLLASLIVAVTATVLTRGALVTSRQVAPEPVVLAPVDSVAAALRLGRALTFRTISVEPHLVAEPEEFLRMGRFLEESFPLVHRQLDYELINGYSRIYRWKGTDRDMKPILLMGHIDVVPVDSSGRHEWLRPPFSGHLDGESIWGRGALDNKNCVLAILEAVEHLLENGFRPARSVYLAFGHDEEVSGRDGAAVIAETLARRDISFELVLDEGGIVVDGMMAGMNRPVALVGVAEKGYVSLKLQTTGIGGHSSAPPKETTVGIISRAIARLQEHPFEARLDGASRYLFEFLAPEMGYPWRLVMTNLWLFEPLVIRWLGNQPAGSAMIRTTTAPTMLDGGVKDNVLPTRASGIVNHRILPGESISDVVENVHAIVDDPRVTIEVADNGFEPSPLSRTDSDAFGLLQRTIGQLFPEAAVAPFLVVGGTDARYYYRLSRNVYRFVPLVASRHLLTRLHGDNEHIAVRDYVKAIQFYHQFIKNASGSAGSAREPNALQTLPQ